MELRELLFELRENILHDRSDRTSGHADVLWSDETLVRYINEAQRRLAHQGLVIRDGTSAITQVTLATDDALYPLDKAVLAVISARLAGEAFDMVRVNHGQLNGRATQESGKPVYFATDEHHALVASANPMSAMTLRVHPAPSASYDGDVVGLRVVRMPLTTLKLGSVETLEVPEEHHLEMLDWAAYLALRIVDADAGDPARAQEFRASFEQHVRAARQMALRRLFAPSDWGFGRNGWVWEN